MSGARMGTRTSYEPGTFCWVDLSTPEPAAAKAFYGELFGWTASDAPIVTLDGHPVAAIVEQPASESERGVPPHWNSYISVEDADATLARAGELGANVLGDSFAIEEHGRIGALIDPTGARVFLWQPGNHIGAGIVNVPGALNWNELATTDIERATGFYSELFGWRTEPLDTGGGPAYTVVLRGDRDTGGIREQLPEEREAGAPANWAPYFAVVSLDDAIAKARDRGAATLFSPLPLPNGGSIAGIRDPQGAAFALWDGRLDD